MRLQIETVCGVINIMGVAHMNYDHCQKTLALSTSYYNTIFLQGRRVFYWMGMGLAKA